jgi:Holliday junction DNA helicase RuvA
MIGALRGTVWRKLDSAALIDCGGVGYLVTMSAHALQRLGPSGSAAELEVHTHVREDALVLFGFVDTYEKDVFELLLSVSGIGPKMAINVLSGLPAEALVHAIARDDLAVLTKIPGVGKKTAERLLVELRAAVKKLGAVPAVAGTPSKGPRSVELLSALVNLGYKPAQVEALADKLLKEQPDASFEVLVREALKSLR